MSGWWKSASIGRRLLVGTGAAAVYSAGALGTYIYFQNEELKENKSSNVTSFKELLRNSKEIYDANASMYDSSVGWDEYALWLPLIRRALISNATGNVLEVGAGTSANLAYYNPKSCETLTSVDISPEMLRQGQLKAKKCKLQQWHYGVMDSRNLREFKDDTFDTVVQSFGLCSVDEPTVVLDEISRVCKTSDGVVLLLEHGKSHYDWLNNLLDKYAKNHLTKWGCLWNRDIERLVSESGMEIISYRRFHFGTTHYIVARPGGGRRKK